MSRKPPALGAPDKLTFLLSLVPYLMDHDEVTVTDVATHFGISPERVRDAVNLIAMSGVPGDTHQYLHGDLFDIQWDEFENNDRIILTNLVAIDDSPRFSAREAAALIAGLQYLSSLPENADRDAIASLMAKLTRGASSTPSQLAVAQPGSADTLALIQSAVHGNRQLEFDYLNARGEQERRRVDPLRVESVDNDWYLRGWCHLREAVRTFRLDRMSHPVVTDEAIAEHAGDIELPDSLFVGSADDLTVEIELPAAAGALIADYLPEGTTGSIENDRMRVTLRVAHYHGLKRLVTGLAGVVTVVDPPEARAIVAEWAEAGAARYDAAPSADSPAGDALR
jgi:proteasome accessory factor C